MPDWRVDLLRRSYRAWERQDPDALVAVWTHDCEWETGPVAMAGFQPVYRGHAGLRSFTADAASVFDAISATILELREADDQILVRAKQEGHSPGRDVRASMQYGQVAEFADKLIRRVAQPTIRLPAGTQPRRSTERQI